MNTLNHHDAKQIDNYVGAMRVPPLPRSLHLGLVDLLNRELTKLPPLVGHELKSNIVAQVSLCLKASKTEEIYAAEATRNDQQRKAEMERDRFLRLAEAKRRHQKIVDYLETCLFKKSMPRGVIEQSFTSFCEAVALDADSTLLIDWATQLLTKWTATQRGTDETKTA